MSYLKQGLLSVLLLTLDTTAGYGGAHRVIDINRDIRLQPIAAGIWIHTSFVQYPRWGRIGANGLLVVDGTQAAFIDTPWTNEQTDVLLDWVASNLKARVDLAIVTHSHEDCMGGLAAVHRRGGDSYATELTGMLARNAGMVVPKNFFSGEKLLKLGTKEFVCNYLGAGHTSDNYVVWLPGRKILFGGCLIKSKRARTLGNVKEADVEAWIVTLQNLKNRFPAPAIVVPGHGAAGGSDLIDHTMMLCKQHLAKTSR